MVKTLTVNPSGNVGSITYNWSYTQTFGTPLSGTSLTNGSNSVDFTFPNTVLYNGSIATTGDYAFTFQCSATDTGVGGCVIIRTITLYFDDVPPTCQLVLSNISIT